MRHFLQMSIGCRGLLYVYVLWELGHSSDLAIALVLSRQYIAVNLTHGGVYGEPNLIAMG